MSALSPWSRFWLDGVSGQTLARAAIVPVAAHLGLLILHRLSTHIAAAVLLFGIGFVGVLAAPRILSRTGGASLLQILMVAAGLRLLLLPVPSSLSDDVYRYIWDGRVVSAGASPYRLPPAATELESLRDEMWEGLPHKDVASVYPPGAQLVFAGAANLPGSVWILKAFLALADLTTCLLLARLAQNTGVPVERTVWYAWNPLVTFESAVGAHVDTLGVLAIVGATLLVRDSRRQLIAALAAGAGVLIKLVPLLAIPVWGRASARSMRFVCTALAVAAVGLIPMVAGVGGAPPGLVTYGISWEFNGPLYEPLWRVLDGIGWDQTVHRLLDEAKQMTDRHQLLNRIYPLNYPRLWAKLILAVTLMAALSWAWRESRTEAALRKVFGATILCSATVYPWYVLWVLPWAVLTADRAWLLLSGLVLISYLPQYSAVEYFPWVYLAIWVPFAIIFIRERSWSMH